MAEKETNRIKEIAVESAGIELHTENNDLALWAKNSNELLEVVKIYLKNFAAKKRGGII